MKSYVITTQLYSSQNNRETIEALKNQYPFLEVGSIGQSVMGEDIPYIKMGEGEKEVFYNASFHANESITTTVLLKFVEDYARAVATGGNVAGIEAGDMYRNTTLYVVPMVNPDGVNLANGYLTSGPYYERAQQIADIYPFIPFPSGWKANIEGIDLNLQFPAGWELAKEIKYNMGYVTYAPRDYVGDEPLQAPESRHIYDFTLAHDFRVIIAYHTQGEVIYWKFLDFDPPGAYELAQYYSSVSGYTIEETPRSSGYAGYKDWFIQEYNRPGFTVEVGRGMNPIPVEQFPGIYADNVGILAGTLVLI